MIVDSEYGCGGVDGSVSGLFVMWVMGGLVGVARDGGSIFYGGCSAKNGGGSGDRLFSSVRSVASPGVPALRSVFCREYRGMHSSGEFLVGPHRGIHRFGAFLVGPHRGMHRFGEFLVRPHRGIHRFGASLRDPHRVLRTISEKQ